MTATAPAPQGLLRFTSVGGLPLPLIFHSGDTIAACGNILFFDVFPVKSYVPTMTAVVTFPHQIGLVFLKRSSAQAVSELNISLGCGVALHSSVIYYQLPAGPMTNGQRSPDMQQPFRKAGDFLSCL